MKARGVLSGYVEGLNDARTKLADFFSSLVRVGGARTYRGQHRYGGNLGGTLGFPVKLGLHTIPALDPLMNHIPSGR